MSLMIKKFMALCLKSIGFKPHWVRNMRDVIDVETIYVDPRFQSPAEIHRPWKRLGYGSVGAGAVDIVACNQEPILLKPGDRVKISTGIAFWLDDVNVGAFQIPRSGIGSEKGIILGNGTGLIDSDFQGVFGIPLWNSNPTFIPDENGNPVYNKDAEFLIFPGERICQLYLGKIVHGRWNTVTRFSRKTKRGDKGFGSTNSGQWKHDPIVTMLRISTVGAFDDYVTIRGISKASNAPYYANLPRVYYERFQFKSGDMVAFCIDIPNGAAMLPLAMLENVTKESMLTLIRDNIAFKAQYRYSKPNMFFTVDKTNVGFNHQVELADVDNLVDGNTYTPAVSPLGVLHYI